MRRVRSIIVAATIAAAFAATFPARASTQLYFASTAGEQFRGYTVPLIAMQPGDSVTYVELDAVFHDVVAYCPAAGLVALPHTPLCDGHDPSTDTDLFGPDTAACAEARTPAGKCPLFWTPLIGLSKTSPVYGIEALPEGVYAFKCTIHPAMKGTLVVQGVPG